LRFRNGAVAFAYLWHAADGVRGEGRVTLDDTVDHWMPMLPEANQVTLKMLANQTSGYPDFETEPAWTAAFNADPFHIFTYDERIRYAFSRSMQFPPGTN
jgi:CubicO group peptidase (beta-lactamase class C family)